MPSLIPNFANLDAPGSNPATPAHRRAVSPGSIPGSVPPQAFSGVLQAILPQPATALGTGTQGAKPAVASPEAQAGSTAAPVQAAQDVSTRAAATALPGMESPESTREAAPLPPSPGSPTGPEVANVSPDASILRVPGLPNAPSAVASGPAKLGQATASGGAARPSKATQIGSGHPSNDSLPSATPQLAPAAAIAPAPVSAAVTIPNSPPRGNVVPVGPPRAAALKSALPEPARKAIPGSRSSSEDLSDAKPGFRPVSAAATIPAAHTSAQPGNPSATGPAKVDAIAPIGAMGNASGGVHGNLPTGGTAQGPSPAQSPSLSQGQPAAANPDPFHHLESGAQPTVLQASSQRLSVAVPDASLGPLQVRVQTVSGQVEATVAVGTAQSHVELAAQAASLSSFVHQQVSDVSRVTVERLAGPAMQDGASQQPSRQGSSDGGHPPAKNGAAPDTIGGAPPAAASTAPAGLPLRLTYIDLHA